MSQTGSSDLRCAGPGSRAFTLAELLVVLVLVAVILGAAAPSLSRFMHGRTMTEEARLIVSLTRYARSAAASHSTPIEVWFEADTGTYGVATAPGYQIEVLPEETTYTVPTDVRLTVSGGSRDAKGRVTIVYLPDGTLGTNSLDDVTLTSSRDPADVLRIARVPSSPRYAIEP